ncbi:MAG: SLC13 family permease, partial [Shewanella sp.]
MQQTQSRPPNHPVASNLAIVGVDIVLLFLLKEFLPYEPEVNTGLAILVFTAILWLTEAIHLSVTAILVPIVAVALGVFDVKTAMSNFSNPIIYLFFGGFVMAAALNYQGIDKLIANKVLKASKGKLSSACLLM